ncbi:hypothetical protein KRR39_05550 [Nocardioides panacis]|uniref:Uncharacterized protein n=1 Tax=Nocardioides panacis TaxID=2849501 RepID=A0A975T0N8_9ACTN|nr:hypothetical protein [Nocardioides panacis]QWZ09252.1 hypothetical protein KRR39_05550 [Nocardioides panacis]
MLPGGLIAVLLVVGVTWLVVRTISTTGAVQTLAPRERQELEALRALVDDLKETAWEHRELDSPLSTIVIDKIRTYERHRRDLGG